MINVVTVVNATGIASAATTAINLANFLEDDVARLISCRVISRAVQTVTFTGTAIAAHTHNVEAEGTHTHNVEAEPTHTHNIVTTGGAALSGAGHSHPATAQAAGAFTPTTNAAGAFTPTVNSAPGHTPAGTVGNVLGLVHTNMAVQASGLLDATYITPAANSVALTGRQTIMLGDALASTSILELRVLYFRECAGVF